MSNYEFWDELGKIFNAVVAYQEKNIEFNKRFINPWIRLGNVFDKQDRRQEAIEAYRKAVELDPASAQNWSELGNAYFRAEIYDLATEAFNKAIELDPKLGWPYSNLALTLVTQAKYEEAIPLYRKSLELLLEEKDRAVAWNRLGNVYRKLNDYEHAVQAFQKADELDGENAGFRDTLDEASEGPSLVEGGNAETSGGPAEVVVSPIQLIVEEGQAEEIAAERMSAIAPAAPAPASQSPMAASAEAKGEDTGSKPEVETAQPQAVDSSAKAVPNAPVAAGSVTESKAEVPAAEHMESASPASVNQPSTPPSPVEETLTTLVQNTVETYTDSIVGTGNSEASPTSQEPPIKPAAHVEETATPELEQTPNGQVTQENTSAASAGEAVGEEALEVKAATPQVSAEAAELAELEVSSEGVIQATQEANSVSDEAPTPDHAAYEEFLKDNSQELDILAVETAEKAVEDQDAAAQQELVTKIDDSGEFQIEMDTKNAHVWNELGNVYFNTSAYDDAIVAYSKAIELDRGFAWPYSNLALAYVQKGRFVEAILLYERSIELFASDKDKAISWNRLGNVHRRLNDYDKAISAYQRADELDPANTTLSLQSRFSLLGNYHVEQKPSYVS